MQVAILGADAGASLVLIQHVEHTLRQPLTEPAGLQKQGPSLQHVSKLHHLRRFDLCLLMPPAQAASTDAFDRQARHILAQINRPFTALHGKLEEQVASAVMLIRHIAARITPTDTPIQKNGHWFCANCSDPDCEYRLFKRLQPGA